MMSEKDGKFLEQVLKRLRDIGVTLPDLKEATVLYESILIVLLDSDVHIAPVAMTRDEAGAKMKQGLPLLYGLNLELDLNEILSLMLYIADVLEKRGKSAEAGYLRNALQEEGFDLISLLQQIMSPDEESIRSSELHPDIVTGLFRTVAEYSLIPAFHAWRRQLIPLIKGIPWNKGTCLICGSTAKLGELQGNNLEKHLRCGRCSADWKSRRLECVHCGNEDHYTFGYIYPERQREKLMIEVCDKCRGYLKVITTFLPTPPELLTVEDLATIHLDYIAQARGYVKIPPVRQSLL